MACQNNRDKALINLLVFIDFKKPFDMVDPKLLLIKYKPKFQSQLIILLKFDYLNVY